MCDKQHKPIFVGPIDDWCAEPVYGLADGDSKISKYDASKYMVVNIEMNKAGERLHYIVQVSKLLTFFDNLPQPRHYYEVFYK